MRSMAESCIDACSNSCSTLADAATAFLTMQEGQTVTEVVEPIVCGAQDKFARFFQNHNLCAPLVTQAVGLGITLPQSAAEMQQQCANSLLETDASSVQNRTRNACTSGMVGKIHSFAPDCLDSCSGMCNPLQQAVTQYLTAKTKKKEAVKNVVCRYKSQFACALKGNNLKKCQPVITRATAMGIYLPNSVDKLYKRCR